MLTPLVSRQDSLTFAYIMQGNSVLEQLIEVFNPIGLPDLAYVPGLLSLPVLGDSSSMLTDSIALSDTSILGIPFS